MPYGQDNQHQHDKKHENGLQKIIHHCADDRDAFDVDGDACDMDGL